MSVLLCTMLDILKPIILSLVHVRRESCYIPSAPLGVMNQLTFSRVSGDNRRFAAWRMTAILSFRCTPPTA